MLCDNIYSGKRVWARFGLSESGPSKWSLPTLLWVEGQPLGPEQVSHLRIITAAAEEREVAQRDGFRFAEELTP